MTSATEWSIRSTDESWLTVSPSSGSGDAQVTVTALRNGSKEEVRKAKLVCSYNDLSMNVPVSQGINPEDPVFSITPTSVSVPAGGDTFSIVVVSDARPYEITIVDEWISLVSREGDRHSGETIVFKARPNIRNASRNGVVSVCTENGSCIPVMVSQEDHIATYAHHHAAYRFTATWCGWCPYMDEAFQAVARERSDFDYVTFHASKGYPLYFAACGPLVSAYYIASFPTGVLNGWQNIENNIDENYNVSPTVNYIIAAMNSFDESFPCLSEITFTSAVENGTVEVDARVTSSITGEIKVVALLLESEIVQTQERFGANAGTYTNFVHNRVARALLSGSILGDEVSAEADVASELHWSKALDSSWVPENLSVFVGVVRSYNELSGTKAIKYYPDNYIENSRLAPVGQAVSE